MPQIGYRDLHLLSDYVADLYAGLDLEGFPVRAIGRLAKLVPADVATYHEYDAGSEELYFTSHPPSSISHTDSERIYQRHLAFLADLAQEGPVRLAGTARHRHGWTMSASAVKASARRGDPERCSTLTVPMRDGGFLGIGLVRGGRPFTAQERGLLRLVQPHLLSAYSNCAAVSRTRREVDAFRQWLSGPNRAVVVLTNNGRIKEWTAEAREWVRRYCNAIFPHTAYRLPECFHDWYRQQLRLDDARRGINPPRAPLVVKGAERALAVHFLVDHGRDEHLLLLEEQRAGSASSLAALGLTQREGDVLYWVAQGKTNHEVGMILELSDRTVQKHLEHIYRKLSVETRTAAALKARESLAAPPSPHAFSGVTRI